MNNKQLTYRQYAWKEFKKNKPALISFYLLITITLIAILSPLLANDQPLYAKYKGESFYPAFTTYFDKTASEKFLDEVSGDTVEFSYQNIDWRRMNLENVWWPLIPYSPTSQDKYNRDYADPNKKQRLLNSDGEMVELPRRLRHFWGADKLGRDVASGIIHGAKISLLVGLVSTIIAFFIGLTLGSTAGYFGDNQIKITRLQFVFGWIGLFIGYFYGLYIWLDSIEYSFGNNPILAIIKLILCVFSWGLIVFVFSKLGKIFSIGGFLKKKIYFPIDSYVNRLMEVLNSLPIIIVIISLSTIVTEGKLAILILLLGVTGWTGVARLVRAEMLRIKNLEYIQASKVLGYSNLRIIFKHALPNGLAPVFVTFAFGVASAILSESALSFLGIGVPSDMVTWGSMLSAGRSEFEAWWLVIYPGLAIFITLTVCNLIGEGLRDALDPKHKK